MQHVAKRIVAPQQRPHSAEWRVVGAVEGTVLTRYERAPRLPEAFLVGASQRASFAEVWLGGRLWRCLPLTLGLRTPGLYLRRRDGRALFCRVRDTGELAASIDALRGRPA